MVAYDVFLTGIASDDPVIKLELVIYISFFFLLNVDLSFVLFAFSFDFTPFLCEALRVAYLMVAGQKHTHERCVKAHSNI